MWYGRPATLDGNRVNLGSWDGVIGELSLGKMDLGSLSVQNVLSVSLSMRLQREEINLGKGTAPY